MKLIHVKSALKYDSFNVAICIKIPFFRVLVTIEPGRSLLQFVTKNYLISAEFIIWIFTLGIAVEKWYQMCLLNFKSYLIAKEIRDYPLLLSK